MVQLSIVIPLYNEEKACLPGINDISNQLEKSNIDYELILINNGSSDSTGEIINSVVAKNPRIRKEDLKNNQGYGGGILFGLNKSLGDFIGFTSCDGEIDGKDLVDTFKKMLYFNGDIAKTNRVERSDGFIRNIISKGYMALILALFLKYIPDINGYPKIMKKDVFKKLNIKSKDWFIDSEIMFKAEKMGLKVVKKNVIYKKRRDGKSHIEFNVALEFLKNIINVRIRGFKYLDKRCRYFKIDNEDK